MSAAADPDQRVDVDGRTLTLRRLQKVLYPVTGTTKGEVLDYYARIAPVLLPQLAGRPATRIRWPDGTGSTPFFEKNIPTKAPAWLRTVVLPTPGSSRGKETLEFPMIDDLAGLMWAANLAALELHVPQWTVGPRGGVHPPTRLVIDLDPGAPAGLDECGELALLLRERLREDGLDAFPVTSGSKGMQLYAPLAGTQDAEVVSAYAKRLAESLAAARPDLVVARMTKSVRGGKVFLDWSQNNAAKTTVCPYSLRGRDQPWVAAPRTWDEVEAGGLRQLHFTTVLERVADSGDLGAGLLGTGPALPTS